MVRESTESDLYKGRVEDRSGNIEQFRKSSRKFVRVQKKVDPLVWV